MPFFRDYFINLLEYGLILIIFFLVQVSNIQLCGVGFNLIFLNILKGYKTLGGVLFSVRLFLSIVSLLKEWYNTDNGTPPKSCFFFLFLKKKHIPLFVIHLFKLL